MATPTVYVICDQNCKYEGMTKEQIITAIVQAVNDGYIGDIDAGFVQTIKTINGHALKFFVGEQTEYNALTDEEKKDLFAIITNDTTREGLLQTIDELQTGFDELQTGLVNGTIVVKKAEGIEGVQKRVLVWSGEFNVAGASDTVNVFTDSAALVGRTFEIVTKLHGTHKITFSTNLTTHRVVVELGAVLYFYIKDWLTFCAYYNGTLENATYYPLAILEVWELVNTVE